MDLIERDEFLVTLQSLFKKVAEGEGHCILISGEAGIGKTSLIKSFCRDKKKRFKVYQGSCDSLFTPRPLAPFYDILWQMQGFGWENKIPNADRSALFATFLQNLENHPDPVVIVFEDIHWADEATLDFIKFLARRIMRLHCLCILSYRDNDIYSLHPLRNMLGQLPPDSFTRLPVTPLSRDAVEKMAREKGYKGEDVYLISGGNPFYVTEILASYSHGIPENIKDSILSVYNGLDERTKQLWQLLSVIPTGFEIQYLDKIEPSYAATTYDFLELKILVLKGGLIFFKHELYRRTIETSLSPHVRLALNKKILDKFWENFEYNGEIERIVHHAKNANEHTIVVKYAPLAAKKAADVGAHIEAARLYYTAIEYYQGSDKDLLVTFYDLYAYECYLTNQIKEAIIYTRRSLVIWQTKGDLEKMANCMRLLSRLWWFDGNRKNSINYALQAIEVLYDQPPSKSKAMAYSTMSQLKMLSDEQDECINWGEKAIAMAEELGDEETLCHALNNVGTVQMDHEASRQRGIEMLNQSLSIALKNSYDDHAARAYTNLSSNAVEMKDYGRAKEYIENAILYCSERNLDSYATYLTAYKSRFYLGSGNWSEAYAIADNLFKSDHQQSVVRIIALITLAIIKMRRGDREMLPILLEAKIKAFETMEAQRIIPVLVALLEYEWITGTHYIEKSDLDYAIRMNELTGNLIEKNEFSFWLLKSRGQKLPRQKIYEGYNLDTPEAAVRSGKFWEQLGCPYEQALSLFEGNENNKKEAISIVLELGAIAVYEKMKLEMRSMQIKNIPRGSRKTTRSNAANLTERELDVLQLLKEDLQNKEIGARLFISPKTVNHHITSILFKLDVNSRTKAVRKALLGHIINES